MDKLPSTARSQSAERWSMLTGYGFVAAASALFWLAVFGVAAFID